jgi:hypothetical protein
MKKSLAVFFVVGLSFVIPSKATIRTVSNDANNPAQYPDIPQAVSAASAGDTIYVNGTQYKYSNVTINKKLIMIGAGYTSSNQFNLITQVDNISFFKDSGVQDGSGSVITGFRINYGINLAGGSLPINNIRIFRNWVGGIDFGWYGPLSSNWTIYNNIFSNSINGQPHSGNTGISNVIIQNNIFVQNQGVVNFNQSSVVVDHNLFIHGNAFSYLQYTTITNNIIISSDNTRVMDANVVNCTFSGNLSLSQNISGGTPTNSFLAQQNTGGSNIVGSDPLFVTVSDFNNYNAAFNYRLQTGSPGHSAGTDGTDMGIYGGPYPFPSGGAPGSGYDTSPLPAIPQVTGMNIQNASVLPGTQLKVTVQATVNN